MPPEGSDPPKPDTASPSLATTATIDAPVSFGQEDRIGGRYRIVRFIAEGGMGQVYEAEDLLLKEHVALKTIHAHIAKDVRAVERFKREIQLARRVTHENVCRIFDVGLHTAASGQEVAFLSMELLSGETLADRIRKQGPFGVAEARPIVDQLVAGLSAAHRAGVVHRDFKSSNVILVNEGGRTRAVITDFGLARPDAGAGGGGASVTGTGDLVGSPYYMAPEQVEGGTITPAVDLYALGVVLYELMTGEMPFKADSALAVAVKRLKEAPPRPRTHRSDLDPRWDAAIMRCLERLPEDRFAQAGDLLRVLDGKPSFKRRYLVGAAAALAAIVGVAVWQLRAHPREGSATAPQASAASSTATGRRAVAVIGFRNSGGRPDDAWLSDALAEMLSSELGAGEGVRTIPGESIARMKKDLSLTDADGYGADTLSRIQKQLGADYVVVGSYVVVDERVRLDARLQDTRTGETVAHVAEAAPKNELLELVARAGGRIRAPLGASELSASQRQEARARLPRSPEAQRTYTEGVAMNRVGECKAAEELLAKTIELEPEFALAHAELSHAVFCLGREEESLRIAKRSLDLSTALPRRERLEIEAIYATRAKEWDRSAEAYRTLFEFFPENVLYGLNLAEHHLRQSQLDEAERVLASLKKVPPPEGNAPMIFLFEYQLAKRRRDDARARVALGRAAEEASARGERANLAMLRSFQGDQYLEDIDYARAISAYQEFRAVSEELQDDDGVSWAIIAEAGAHAAAGELARARRVTEEGLALATKVGSRRRLPQAHGVMLDILLEQGHLAEADRECDTFAALGVEMAIPQIVVGATRCHAVVAVMRGDLARGERLLGEAEAGLTKLGMPLDLFGGETHRAFLAWDRGDLAGAKALAEKELARASSVSARINLQRLLALVALDDDRPADAERFAREILGAATRAKALREELHARSLLAMALVRQEKLREAADAVAPVAAQLALLEGLRDVALATKAIAEVRRDPASIEALRQTVARLRKAGMAGFALRCRLILAQLEKDRGELAAVEREARARGFLAVAKQASARRP